MERQRPQGVWDPPGHISLPPSKLLEGQKAARSRRLAAVAAESRACVPALPASSMGLQAGALAHGAHAGSLLRRRKKQGEAEER